MERKAEKKHHSHNGKSWKKHDKRFHNNKPNNKPNNKHGSNNEKHQQGAHQKPTGGVVQQQGAGQSVYKRVPTLPTLLSKPLPTDYFVLEDHPRYQELIEGPYSGFQIEQPGTYPDQLGDSYKRALMELDNLNYYQYDMTQPAGLGTKIARTFVSRCLVGDPGMTYKYLGLRMFAHPWTAGALGANSATITIGELNEQIRSRAQALNESSGKDIFGSSQFNLTLINRCFPSSVSARTFPLKKEPHFGKDLCSVSWHADSSLDHYSTIAVFHFEVPQSTADNATHDKGWRVGLRVQVNAEGPQQGKPAGSEEHCSLPAVSVSLPEECIYYMLDDFNHHHQHAVLAGETDRYASTHRVSRVEGHSFAYIAQRCTSLLGEKLKADKASIRKTLLLADEVEYEWLRQYYIQGSKHHQLHEWWHEPMRALLQQLGDIETRIVKQFAALLIKKNNIVFKKDGSHATKQEKKLEILATTVTEDAYAEMKMLLTERWEKRRLWLERERDPLFSLVAEDLRPMPLPLEEVNSHWTTHLGPAILNLGKQWQDDVLLALS